MRRSLFALLILLPALAHGKEEQEEYGVGLVCPRTELQVSFYTENNQQDAAGNIAYGSGAYAMNSDTVKSLQSAGAHTMDGLCDAGAPGIRIDSKRDGWLQAGSLWLPPNQEWDYADWQDFLRKSAVWKPLVPLTLYKGTADAPDKDKPYSSDNDVRRIEIYPLKFADDWALVLLDTSGAYAKNCAGIPFPPQGRLGWLRLGGDSVGPVAVPAHLKGC